MRLSIFLSLALAVTVLLTANSTSAATLKDQVPQAFQSVYGRKATATEIKYWTGRVTSGEKKTYQALIGAMSFHKSKTATNKVDDKQTLIKDVLTLFISTYGNNPTEAEKAWWRKRISCGEIKNRAALIASMNFHKSKKVRKGSPYICGLKAEAGSSSSSGAGVTRRAVAGIGDHPAGEVVRIGIYKTNGSAIKVTADGNFQVRTSDEQSKLGKDDVIAISWSGNRYHIQGSRLEIDTEDPVRLVPEGGAIMQITSYSDPSKTYPGKNYNRFRGVIEIRKCTNCDELWAINELRTEHYLWGLAETSGEGPEEYLKALASAARTYVLYHKVITDSRFPTKGFVIGNTPNDQVYRGYEYEIIAPRFAEMVNASRGVVVTDSEGDKPVAAVYFSDSDGRTRSAKEVWNSSRFPYLQSVADPHHVAKSCVGHCVGLSAQGAYGLAKADNWNFKKILTYYYKGVKLIKAY